MTKKSKRIMHTKTKREYRNKMEPTSNSNHHLDDRLLFLQVVGSNSPASIVDNLEVDTKKCPKTGKSPNLITL